MFPIFTSLNKTSLQQQEIDPLSYSFKVDQFLVQNLTVLEVGVIYVASKEVLGCRLLDGYKKQTEGLKDFKLGFEYTKWPSFKRNCRFKAFTHWMHFICTKKKLF